MEYLHEMVLPQMVATEQRKEFVPEKEWCNNAPLRGMSQDEYDEAATKTLKWYGLTFICPTMVYQWMKNLGFKYLTRKKGYYVDGHAMVEYHWVFMHQHLRNKHCMHRWTQISLTKNRGVRSCPKDSQWIKLSIHWWQQLTNGWISCWCLWRFPRENGNVSKIWR